MKESPVEATQEQVSPERAFKKRFQVPVYAPGAPVPCVKRLLRARLQVYEGKKPGFKRLMTSPRRSPRILLIM